MCALRVSDMSACVDLDREVVFENERVSVHERRDVRKDFRRRAEAVAASDVRREEEEGERSTTVGAMGAV